MIFSKTMRGLIICACVALVWPARADEAQEIAKVHYQAGESLYAQGHFREALLEFGSAYEISRKAGLLYNIAVCHERLDEIDAAIATFERFLAEVPEDRERGTIEARVAALKERKRAGEARASLLVVAPAPAPVARKPLYKRAWFWAVIGTSAAVVAGAVAAGVVVGTRPAEVPTLPTVDAR
jgi:tetratricopeptide (TPR) repeat protein